jgi:hypothetical protein
MLAPVAPTPTTGALPAYAEPAVAETTRAEDAQTVAASEDSQSPDTGAETGADGGTGPQADGTLGATLDAALAQKAADEAADAEAAADQDAGANPNILVRQEAEAGYAEAKSAMGMTE